jgi:hypothetical protein
MRLLSEKQQNFAKTTSFRFVRAKRYNIAAQEIQDMWCNQ